MCRKRLNLPKKYFKKQRLGGLYVPLLKCKALPKKLSPFVDWFRYFWLISNSRSLFKTRIFLELHLMLWKRDIWITVFLDCPLRMIQLWFWKLTSSRWNRFKVQCKVVNQIYERQRKIWVKICTNYSSPWGSFQMITPFSIWSNWTIWLQLDTP